MSNPNKPSNWRVLTNGILKENPTLVLILGTCPTLAVTTMAVNGIGMGIGFTLALFAMGSIREILGNGTWMSGAEWLGIQNGVSLHWDNPIIVFLLAPGGFLVFGALIALVNHLTHGKAIKKKEFGCAGCPSAAACAAVRKGGADE